MPTCWLTQEGGTPPIVTRLQQAMPEMLIRVDGVRESLQADIQIVRDRVEQSLESANSIISSFRDDISSRVPFFVNIGVLLTVSESKSSVKIVPAGAATSMDESAQNAVLTPAVPVYKMSMSLVCITDVWREYKVGLGQNPRVENVDRDYTNA